MSAEQPTDGEEITEVPTLWGYEQMVGTEIDLSEADITREEINEALLELLDGPETVYQAR